MMLNSRRKRLQFFNAAMFGEPAWDMLLALCACEEFAAPPTVSALGAASGAPATTALRWLSYLENQGLVTRHGSLHDQRVQLVELTEKARGLLNDFFSADENH